MSEWGRLFSRVGILPAGHPLDLPNAAFGIIYFSLVLLHPLLPLGSYQASDLADIDATDAVQLHHAIPPLALTRTFAHTPS